MGRSIVGLDIGSEMLRGVEVERGASAKPVVVRYKEVPTPEGAVRGGEVLEPNTVALALKQLWAAAGFRSKNVVLGVGNSKVLVRDLTVPRLTQKEIRAALPFQVQEMLPVPVVDALLDFYPVSESETDGGPVVNGLLVAAVKTSVLANVQAVVSAGLNPVEVDLIPFALNRTLVRGPHHAGFVALVDVGSATTNMLITRDGVPQFARIIPAGGADVNRALVGRLGLSPEQAERGKRQLGLDRVEDPELAEASEVIHELTRDLLNSLRNTLSFFVNSRGGAQIQRIVVSGGAASMTRFAEALSDVTRIPVITQEPFAGIAVSKGADRNPAPTDPSNMSVALGLALGRAA